MSWNKPMRAPWWFTVLLVLVCFPTVAFIPQAAQIVEDAQWLGTSYVGWLYPVYVVLSAVCSWICYPTRRALAWILFALIVITDLSLLVSVLIQ